MECKQKIEELEKKIERLELIAHPPIDWEHKIQSLDDSIAKLYSLMADVILKKNEVDMQPFIGDLFVIVIFAFLFWEADRMDKEPKNYTCPSYCEIEHEHFLNKIH